MKLYSLANPFLCAKTRAWSLPMIQAQAIV
jgi:hypothetical protein